MAGVSDCVFRSLCLQYGADYAVSEMVASNPRLRDTTKTQRRLDHSDAAGIRIVQIAGADPHFLAEAARYCADNGADVIDINMGCPAKKVCNKLAGSALMRDETLVSSLLSAVVAAVDVPVTLKMRTGWDPEHRNAPTVARIAEALGISALTIHGRTRACRFNGQAEYDTIAEIKQLVSIPVIANGDIRTAAEAQSVFDHTACDGLMIGRAANGNPWIFQQIKCALNRTEVSQASFHDIVQTMTNHVRAIHELYGYQIGTRVARKHVGWYAQQMPDGESFRQAFNKIETAQAQVTFIENYRNDPQGAAAA
ncbi:MAG: tRNA dihydrouridine synthase DusB [Proteobacteria bacterium]|nr:tRNA dihydrouridine synthase DusB [Pseudomonadota bacterium]